MKKVTEEGMLSPDDYELYAKLNQSLLVFAAQRTGRKPDLKSRKEFLELKLEEKLKIRDALMKNFGLLDEFIGSNPFGFSGAELVIVRGWKDYVMGTFYLVKVTREGGIFLESKGKSPKAYLVLALSTPFEYVLQAPPPAMVEAVLLPFKGRIVYDGMMRGGNILIGGGIARSMRAEVDRAVARTGLITSLPFTQPTSYTEEEKLAYYMRTKESREEHWDEIENILAKNRALLPIYYREMGRANSKRIASQLRDIGVKGGWFAVAGEMVVASGGTKETMQQALDEVLSRDQESSVYVMQLK